VPETQINVIRNERRRHRVANVYSVSGTQVIVNKEAPTLGSNLRTTFTGIAASVLANCPAQGHGISGNRFFPGTMAFDDPAVADELLFELSQERHPGDGGGLVNDTSLAWSFMRLLTPDIGIGLDNTVTNRDRIGVNDKTGEGVTHMTIKGLLYNNEAQETLVSAGLTWGIGGSGDKAVGADRGNGFEPGIFFGKGFGGLSNSPAWLRPFAVTGAVTYELPLDRTSNLIGGAPLNQTPGSLQVLDRETLHWGFSLQYSSLYSDPAFGYEAPKKEPLNQFVPLIEFAFNSPRDQKTSATINPGIAYVAETWQLSAEAIVPLNREGGEGLGFRAQILFFYDDIFPSAFGKPLLSSKPLISTVEKFAQQRE
jgi:hypothetical protein